jgi:hypothetical protein
MAANDHDLIDFLSAHPTYTLDEAANELARRKLSATDGESRDDPRPSEHSTVLDRRPSD